MTPAVGGAASRTPWRSALVTGASSGIGRALAVELAERGVGEVAVVARRRERLDDLAAELAERHGTVVEVIVADLVEPADRARVEARLADPTRPVDLFVNNAGIGTPGRFVDADLDDLERQVQLNVVAAMRLAQTATRAMVERGCGAVLHVGSVASFQPIPGTAVYAAGKAFVLSLGEATHEELRGTGVTVTTLCPGYTRTEFASRLAGAEYADAPAFVWMSPERVASDGLDAVARGRAVCVPGVGYQIVVSLTGVLPRRVKRWLTGRLAGEATAMADRAGRHGVDQRSANQRSADQRSG